MGKSPSDNEANPRAAPAWPELRTLPQSGQGGSSQTCLIATPALQSMCARIAQGGFALGFLRIGAI
jgi:hypothetical protein